MVLQLILRRRLLNEKLKIMENAKLYSLSLRDIKTYYVVLIFAVGNIVFPQICHSFDLGGQIFLPIYFFTLIAAYKYGLTAGVLTAVLSPLANCWLFGMPSAAILPPIIMKSILLAMSVSLASYYSGKISFKALLAAVLFYQLASCGVDFMIKVDFRLAFQDFIVGYPGLLIQVIG